ncbi:hypothetical protein EB796_014574 [Bugula neritina]|uniref:CCHC-type domain-containing protein n=1 Tax=Bugula neritina TaxID=10212 RepID=A0A7J7JNX5_BUGNE|nr:hypothetical protein EB796_014574 [Bugula neritina]
MIDESRDCIIAVNDSLKSMASVEKLSLPELVARARIMLSTRESEMASSAGYQKAKGTCFSCGSTSHMARECPKSTAEIINRDMSGDVLFVIKHHI